MPRENPIKIIFVGGGLFGLPSLLSLIKNPLFSVTALITNPEKRAGRGLKFLKSPLKEAAINYNIPIFQPLKILDLKNEIMDLSPDLLVVASYGQIIPEDILTIPKHGSINIHASLLPKYRGAACLQAAILNDEKKTGVTIMLMDKGLDTGPILYQRVLDISNDDTAATLENKLSRLGGEMIAGTAIKYITGEIHPFPQDNSLATYVPRLKKENGHIDWNNPIAYIERFIRAMYPWPGAFSRIDSPIPQLNGKIIKINKAVMEIGGDIQTISGKVIEYNAGLAVRASDGILAIREIQLPGKKPMPATDFLRGYSKIIGSVLK